MYYFSRPNHTTLSGATFHSESRRNITVLSRRVNRYVVIDPANGDYVAYPSAAREYEMFRSASDHEMIDFLGRHNMESLSSGGKVRVTHEDDMSVVVEGVS